MRKMPIEPAAVAAQVASLRHEKAPDGRSLFLWATHDSAVFWLIAHAQEVGIAVADALTVLNPYAGGAIPMVLTMYADTDECFRAAMDSLLRFDNFDNADRNKRSTAARFLAHYHADPAFKAELAEHGARLVVAVSTGQSWAGESR